MSQHHDHDHHDHDHAHDHGHHHHVDPDGNQRAFALAISLNVMFVAIEFTYGFIANSTALMADAGHNLSDVLGLALAWGAAVLAKRAPNRHFTYGLRSSSILAALGNALLLMMACGAIGWEAVQRFSEPAPVAGWTVSIVALVGVAVNGVSAWLFMASSKEDINVRAAYQHMAADAVISLGVAVSGAAIMYSGWSWIDPAVSIVIVALIALSTWSLLRESLRMVLAAVPANVDPHKVREFLQQRPGVSETHDLHIWAMSTTETALTAHLVMPEGYPGDQHIDDIVADLKSAFKIHHCTLQIEQGTTEHGCSLHGHAH
ncbi:MAG: cation transporter [Massilia sp.]|jgi:cobalt-zinc-cadmium efflux system protein|nr:cation transporter [Massilia sp.]